MKQLFVLFLLFTVNQAKANTVSLYIMYQLQPVQNITVASCDTLVIYNQSSTQSYTVHNDIVPGPEPGPVIADFFSNITYVALNDLTPYANLAVRYQNGTEIFNITITPQPQSMITQMICHGSSYFFDGEERTASGTYSQYIPASGPGCDSLVILELTVLPANTNTINASICEGESTSYMGDVYSSPGAYEYLFTAANGCDSTVTFTVVNTPGPQLTVTQTDENTLHISSNAGSSFLWLDCNDSYASTGITGSNFNATENGSYAVSVTYNGCVDTSECLLISQVGLEETTSAEISAFPIPTDNLLTIKTTENQIGTPFYITDLSGKLMLAGKTDAFETPIAIGHLAPGIYTLRMDGEMLRIIRE